jgi:hypothetical protein
MMRRLGKRDMYQNITPRVPFEESEIPTKYPMSFKIAILAIVL